MSCPFPTTMGSSTNWDRMGWCRVMHFGILPFYHRFDHRFDHRFEHIVIWIWLFLPDPCPRAPKETQYCRARRFLCNICQCTQGFATPWGGVGQWWRSFGLDHVGDAMPRIGVGWGGTVLHALAFYRKERMSWIGCEPKKIGDLSQDKDWLKVWRKNEIKDKCSINLYWQAWAHEIFKLDSTIKSAHKTFI